LSTNTCSSRVQQLHSLGPRHAKVVGVAVVSGMITPPKSAACRNSGVSVSRNADSTREKSLHVLVPKQNLLEHVLKQTLLEHVLEQSLLEHVLEQIQLEHEHVLE